jgi:toxin ParE1/3/4
MIRLEWTEPAVVDLENIQDYIARDSAEYADAVIERLILSVDQLESFPESGRRVPESADPKIRELLVSVTELSIGLGRERCRSLQWCMAQEILPR